MVFIKKFFNKLITTFFLINITLLIIILNIKSNKFIKFISKCFKFIYKLNKAIKQNKINLLEIKLNNILKKTKLEFF